MALVIRVQRVRHFEPTFRFYTATNVAISREVAALSEGYYSPAMAAVRVLPRVSTAREVIHLLTPYAKHVNQELKLTGAVRGRIPLAGEGRAYVPQTGKALTLALARKAVRLALYAYQEVFVDELIKGERRWVRFMIGGKNRTREVALMLKTKLTQKGWMASHRSKEREDAQALADEAKLPVVFIGENGTEILECKKKEK